MDWLHDRVFSVRRAAAVNMKQLAALFGEDWTSNHILPRLTASRNSGNNSNTSITSNQRLTMLHVYMELLDIFSHGRLCNSIFKLVIEAANDSVANVRLAVAKVLLKEIEKKSRGFKDNEQDTIYTLNKLSSDTDRDVRFYANRALKHTQLFS